jgi:hypothetical protein
MPEVFQQTNQPVPLRLRAGQMEKRLQSTVFYINSFKIPTLIQKNIMKTLQLYPKNQPSRVYRKTDKKSTKKD